MVGFIVAISAEDDTEMQRLKSDFIDNLTNLLSTEEMTYPFKVIVYPPYLAEKLTTTDDASAALRKSRARFILYGKGKIRTISGKEQHCLNLEGVVRHGRIPNVTQQKFSKEFVELLPRRLLFEKDNDLFSFQITSELADIVSRYIIGIASLLSGELEYAESLFLGIKKRISNVVSHFPAIITIKQRIPLRLIDVHRAWAMWHFNNWRASRNKEMLTKAEEHLDTIIQLSFDVNYFAELAKAICCIVLRRDVNAARKHIRLCRKINDATWRYSDAFLSAYEGKLKESYNKYKGAFKKKCEDSVPVQSEEFIQEIIEEEPHRKDLYFCLGLINYYAKEDYRQAKRDFEIFASQNKSEKYAQVYEIVEAHIIECTKKI
jgi:tetratricopeptide (TPR) repeat protein